MSRFHELLWDIFRQMGAVKNEWGYHLGYSNESAWRTDARFLILTLNPSSKDGRRGNVAIYPESPWAISGKCDFFAPRNGKISPYIQCLFYELARLDGKKGASKETIAAEYAEHGCPISSIVPFRTEGQRAITEEMWKFGREKMWPKIFSLWLPEVIIVMGNAAYNQLKDVFENQLNFSLAQEEIKKISDFPGAMPTDLQYAYSRYDRGDKTVTLIRIPHPTGAVGYKGLPSRFEEHCGNEGTPFRRFLESVLM